MKRLALTAWLILAASKADAIDLDMNLWLDGRWICGGVVSVDEGEQTDLCTSRHNDKPIRLVVEVNSKNENSEVIGHLIEGSDDQKKDRNKFLIVTDGNSPADISETEDGHESFRFKANIIR